jgi:hypothetical protein
VLCGLGRADPAAEISRLRRENDRLRRERDIPKKLSPSPEFLRPAVIEVLDDSFAPAQFGDAVLAAQPGQRDADLLLRRKLPPGGTADLFRKLLCRGWRRECRDRRTIRRSWR